MQHYGTSRGILACTGGFTLGVRQFVLGKSITFMDMGDVIQLARNSHAVNTR